MNNIYIYIYKYTYIYAIMKTMYRVGYYNGYVGNHALGHMMYGCNIVHHVPKCISYYKATVVIIGRAHCFHDSIYITPVLLL